MRIFNLYFFCIALVTFSSAHAQPDPGSHLEAYNAWLESTGLHNLLVAVEIQDTLLAPKGQLKAYPLKTLVIRSSNSHNDATRFAQDLQQVVKQFDNKGLSLYYSLLMKFAFIANASPDSVFISLRSTRPKIFSADIFFHDKLVVAEHGVAVKDPGNTFYFDMDQAMDHIMQGSFRTQGEIEHLRAFLEKSLRSFFYTHNRKEQIEIQKEDYGQYDFKLKAKNIYRHITQRNYHEIVYLDVTLSPLAGNQIEVLYFADAVYSSGILSAPVDESDYRSIDKDFPHEIHSYGQTLYEYFNKAIYKSNERGAR
jgi:hypothetical protein